MLHYELTQTIYNKLLSLAYRIADNAYMIERYGLNDTEVERAQNHKTIVLTFNELDAAGVPFWVQNAALAFGQDWRRYKTDCLYYFLKSRGVDCSRVSCL